MICHLPIIDLFSDFYDKLVSGRHIHIVQLFQSLR